MKVFMPSCLMGVNKAQVGTMLIDFVLICFQVLFEPGQWDFLVDQFKQEFCRLYGMTLEPLLNIYLQAGLSALKTPYPYSNYYYVTTYYFIYIYLPT